MKRTVHMKRPGGSIPGRPLPSGKPSIIALKVGRNEIDQIDLDCAMANGSVARLFAHGKLVLEPVPAVQQPPVPPVAPKARPAVAPKAEPVTVPETPASKAEAKEAGRPAR
jgi:hypothetical protein